MLMTPKSTSRTSPLPSAFSLAQHIQRLIKKLNISSTYIPSEKTISVSPPAAPSHPHLHILEKEDPILLASLCHTGL